MGSKSDMIIEYIERLPVGARISVRGLSRELGVSDGTAYKALKLAEERGLVETRPRAGTVRKQDIKLPRSLSVEAARLGLEVLSGAANMDFPVTKLVLGDVSVQQLYDKLRGGGRGVLCVVGDRPDIFAFAAQHGISLLITGGVHPGEAVLREVEAAGGCVLFSAQDSVSVLGQLLSADAALGVGSSLAGDWMRTPPYLYYNDIVADWHSIYRPIVSMTSLCAVVDDDLTICGTVDAITALSSPPTMKISGLYSREHACFTASEDTGMDELAQRMIAADSATAYITRDGMLRGIITSNDLLRYYRRRQAQCAAAPQLELVEAAGPSGRSVYSVWLPEGSGSTVLPMLLEAARLHCLALGAEASFGSGSFYLTDGKAISGELMVSCEQLREIPGGLVLNVEIYGETERYAGSVLTALFSAKEA